MNPSQTAPAMSVKISTSSLYPREARSQGARVADCVLSFLLLTLPLPPVLPIPDALEVCILKAEICMLECTPFIAPAYDTAAMNGCIAAYEDCSYTFPEAHVDNCRVSYAWCVLESPLWVNPDDLDHCEAVEKLCPSV